MRVIFRILTSFVFRRYPRRVFAGYVSVVGAAGFAIAIPHVLGLSVNRSLEPGGGGVSELYLFALVIMLAGAARGLFAFGQAYLGESLSQKVAYDLRNAYFDKLQHLSFAFHDHQTTGSLMSRATADVEGVRMFVNMGAVRSAFILVMVGGIAASMLLTDVKLALVSLAFVPLIAFQAIVTSRLVRRTWLRVQELTGDMVSILQENLTGIRVVKAFGAEEHEKARFRDQAERVREETFRAERVWARGFGVMNGGFMAATAAILWVGGQEVIAGRTVSTLTSDVAYSGLTPGDLAAFVIYMGLLTMPVRMMGWMVNNFARASSCGERLFDILDQESPVRDLPGAQPLGRIGGRVTFDNVSFAYDGTQVLRDIDVDIAPGDTVALIGRPGSGKSTFAHLIARYYDVSSGRVTLDGVDVRDAQLASVRDNVGIVQQDVFIHTASIEDNISYGAVGAGMERVKRAAIASQLDEFIETLPDGYSSLVGERGVGLSGGQKQRLSIARTLVTDPPVLVLDDSTSSVDSETERAMHAALRQVIRGRTSIIITNRLWTVRDADLVLVFKEGTIVERGTHEELLANGLEYKTLYDSQLRPPEAASRTAPA